MLFFSNLKWYANRKHFKGVNWLFQWRIISITQILLIDDSENIEIYEILKSIFFDVTVCLWTRRSMNTSSVCPRNYRDPIFDRVHQQPPLQDGLLLSQHWSDPSVFSERFHVICFYLLFREPLVFLGFEELCLKFLVKILWNCVWNSKILV